MYRNGEDYKSKTLLGQRLMMLTRLALEARYPDRYPEMKTTDPEIRAYRHSSQAPSPFLFLVALECLRYQCSEGDVPKTPLYEEINRAVDHWRGVILSAIPEYKAARDMGWR